MPTDVRGVARTLAPAKVNLALYVGPKRLDGFHELVTIFQAISLADEVEVEVMAPAREGQADEAIRLIVEGPDLGPVEENLAWRAAKEFAVEARLDRHVSIRLRKTIPAGAGLGGGSSDAAAVLRCLAYLTDFDDAPRLTEIAAGLGSDVAFFLGSSPTAIGRGRGEQIQPVEALPSRPIAVALPPVHVATGPAYRALDASRVDHETVQLPGMGAVVSWNGLLGEGGVNDFEAIVAERHETVAKSLAAMRSAGAAFAMLSGSGAASFALFDESVDTVRAEAWCDGLSNSLGWSIVPCTTLEHMPEVIPM